jgi:hypothetical protein
MTSNRLPPFSRFLRFPLSALRIAAPGTLGDESQLSESELGTHPCQCGAVILLTLKPAAYLAPRRPPYTASGCVHLAAFDRIVDHAENAARQPGFYPWEIALASYRYWSLHPSDQMAGDSPRAPACGAFFALSRSLRYHQKPMPARRSRHALAGEPERQDERP